MKNLLKILRRRSRLALLATLLTLAAGAAITFLLPASFKSTATILVEADDVALEGLVGGMAGYADRRIEVLSKRLLSSATLSQIAKSLELYPPENFDEQGMLSPLALGPLRNAIDINLVKIKAVDPKIRFQVESAIAFDVSFSAKTPERAKQVTDALVDAIFESNRPSTSDQPTFSREILKTQEGTLSDDLGKIEERIREFKENNLYTLPEMSEINHRTLENTKEEISSARLELRAAEQRKIYLESELIRLKPHAISFDAEGNRVLGVSDRLKSLRAELASKRAKYSERHPEIIALQNQLDSLRLEQSSGDGDHAVLAQLKELRASRAAMAEKYAPDHPDLRSLNRQISSLEKELQSGRRTATPRATLQDADNPAYIATSGELKSTSLLIAELRSRISELDAKQREYAKRIEDAPRVEREFTELTRNYERILQQYEATREKSFTSGLATSIGESSYEQGLQLLEPATLPIAPDSPKRKLLLLASAFLAGWAGLATALLTEHFDERLWSVEEFSALAGEPPLAVVPEFKSPLFQRSRASVSEPPPYNPVTVS